MNIIEAVKSGRPFKRSKWTNYFGAGTFFLSTNDILADDWDIEEEKITVTKSQLLQAYSETLKEYHKSLSWSRFDFCKEFLNHLGIK